MSRFTTRLVLASAVLLPALTAERAFSMAAQARGKLVVNDTAKAFSEEGRKKAETILTEATFDRPVRLTIETFPVLPPAKKGEYDAATEKSRFWRAWAKEQATQNEDQGIYVLICLDPGHVEVIVDRQTAERRAFTNDDSAALTKKLTDAFATAKGKPEAEARAARDKGLSDAAEFVVAQLKGTSAGSGSGSQAGATGNPESKPAPNQKPGMSIGGWICLGLCVVLGIWLVIGIIRALSGGTGKGGFMTALLGGLFGAVAGMWLYNSFFAGGSDAYGGESGGDGGDYGDGGGGDGGAGDYGGDYGAGGDF